MTTLNPRENDVDLMELDRQYAAAIKAHDIPRAIRINQSLYRGVYNLKEHTRTEEEKSKLVKKLDQIQAQFNLLSQIRSDVEESMAG